MYELLRYISHLPTLLPHATMEDTTLGGYTIPKDTQVMRLSFIVSSAINSECNTNSMNLGKSSQPGKHGFGSLHNLT